MIVLKVSSFQNLTTVLKWKWKQVTNLIAFGRRPSSALSVLLHCLKTKLWIYQLKKSLAGKKVDGSSGIQNQIRRKGSSLPLAWGNRVVHHWHRELKQLRRRRRRQRRLQNNNRFNSQNNCNGYSSARASRFLVNFFDVHCTTTTWNLLMWHFMEDVDIRRPLVSFHQRR